MSGSHLFVSADLCLYIFYMLFLYIYILGPSCSKLTTSLVKVSLKFQMLISQICQYFFAVQKLLSFFQQKISVYLVIKL